MRPLSRACFSVFALSRLFHSTLVILLAFLAFCFLIPSALAQSNQTYAGMTILVSGDRRVVQTGGSNAVGGWFVEGLNADGTTFSISQTGWNVAFAVSVFNLNVTVPAGAAIGKYHAQYFSATGKLVNGTKGNDSYYLQTQNNVYFQVIAAPPAKPAAGMPAFSWQGSVAGVNTGNGNKTTTVPITGWTMRGGMKVACTLYHNSQGSLNGYYGYKWQASYVSYFSADASGNLTIHWDNGLSYTFTKNSAYNSYTAPIGILDTVSLNGMNHPVLTTVNNTIYTFGYAPTSGQPGYGSAYLSSITDMDGNALTIGHNSDTTISTVTDPTGRALTYGYAAGHLTTITDPLGRQWTLNYSSGNYLGAIELPPVSGQNTSLGFGYADGRQNITGFQNARGFVSQYAYNSDNSLASATDPLGNVTTFAYNPTSTVITDPNGHTTTHTYSYSRLSSVTDALNFSSSTAYDYNNIASSMTDKRGNVSKFSSHFTNGTSTATSTDPLGYSTSSTYDAKNKVLQSVDAIGNVTANTYSTDGKEDLLTTSVTGTGSVPFKTTSSVGGYANGLPTTFTDPLGFTSSVGYDSYGNVNSATDANGHTSTSVSNALGWKQSSTDANNHTTTYTYDNWGRVTAITAPDNTQTTTTYDLDGNVLTVTDANHHTVTNVYDADDRLVQTMNGRGDTVTYTYDGPQGRGSVDRNGVTQYGLLSSKTDGNGHVTTYAYTARNEPYQTVYADGSGEGVAYDPNGNMVSSTKPNGVYITYAYDADNRLTDITYPTLHATHFGYDADGRKTLMTDATGATSWYYGYDGLHLAQLATPQGTNTYVYDGDGRLSYKYVNIANVFTYWYNTYDAAGRLTSLRSTLDGTTTYTYDAADRLLTKTKGSGDYELYGYDACDEVTSIGYWFFGGIMQNALTYSYDPAGNVLTYNQGYYSTTYGYDGADQLVSETSGGPYPPPALGFTYDHNGNRLSQTSGGQLTQSFTYDAHDKLTWGTAGNETDGYDQNGNETSINISGTAIALAYDDEDRLTQFTSSGATDTFTYNGLGLRVGKTDSTGTYSYVCDGADPGSPVLSDGHAVYTPGLSENRAGVSSFYSFDKQGNLWTVDGNSKNQLAYEDFAGFGTITAGGAATPFKFGGGNGCQSDADTGLVLMGHRYYDSRIGRFISQDPAGDGDNWYAYAGNSPTNAVDPDGLRAGLSNIYDPSMPGSNYSGQDAWMEFPQTDGLNGYWDHGVPTGQLPNGQPTIEDGEVNTNWIPGNNVGGGGAMFAEGGVPDNPSLSAYKSALGKVQQIVGKQPGTARGKANNGEPMRGNTSKGYRLDKGHVDTDNVKYPDNEKGVHFNYWDYSAGKRKSGLGVKGAVPVEGGRIGFAAGGFGFGAEMETEYSMEEVLTDEIPRE